MKQESLFSSQFQKTPLASRVRPQNLDQFVGQQQLLGDGKILREIIENDQVSSMIFWGPPGVGKTTLAEIIARRTKSNFLSFSAVDSSISQIKKIMKQAELDREIGQQTTVFCRRNPPFQQGTTRCFLALC